MPDCRNRCATYTHLDLVSDPVSTVAQVYGHFGLALPSAAAAAMERFVTARPNGGYGQHAYRFEDHGLDAEAERQKFRGYMLRFGVVPELPRKAPAAALPAGEVGERSEAG